MGDWTAHWDDSSQAYYYENVVTGETTWDQPTDYDAEEQDDGGSYHSAAQSPTHGESSFGAVEWRLHPEHDTACLFADFVAEYGEADGSSYWDDALPMRPTTDGTVLTQQEFFDDFGDAAGLAAWEAAPTTFDPDTVNNVDPDGSDMSAASAQEKVQYWRHKREQGHQARTMLCCVSNQTAC